MRAFVRRWNILAVVVSRRIPLVAETVAFTAGAFGMRTVAAISGAVVVGPLPRSATLAGEAHRADGVVVFVPVAVAAALCWVVGRRMSCASGADV